MFQALGELGEQDVDWDECICHSQRVAKKSKLVPISEVSRAILFAVAQQDDV